MAELLGSEEPLTPPPDDPFVFQILPLNGFLFRFNKRTGECWRLEPDPANRATMAWKFLTELSR